MTSHDHSSDGGDLGPVLVASLADLAERAPHDAHLAWTVRRRARRRRTALALGTAALGCGAVTSAVLVRPALPASGPSAPAVTTAAACRGTATEAVLPEWARTGFSAPEPVAPYVRSASGDVVAILFGRRLWSPTPPGVNNKVLWAWRRQPGNVTMTARLSGTDRVVTTGLPRPEGPSTVDLPAPGCWRITLAWPGGSDTIDLTYSAP